LYPEEYPEEFAGKYLQKCPQLCTRLRLLLNLNLNLNLDLFLHLDLDLNLYLFLFLNSFQPLLRMFFASLFGSSFASKFHESWASSCLALPRRRPRGRHRRGRKGNRGQGIGAREVRTFPLGRWNVCYGTYLDSGLSGNSDRPRVRQRPLCHRDYPLIRRELGSVVRGCGLRLPLVAELKREAAELVLDDANARVAG
jgi:hypothetical protein